jgi:Kef-type K+ transport system membrane component KefB
MFFIGFEIDLGRFNEVRSRTAVFGASTILFPFLTALGWFYAMGYGVVVSVLVGSIVASHTLLAFPVLNKYKLLEEEAVVVTIGGTILSDISSMILLALCVSVYQTGFSWGFLASEAIELAIFIPAIIFGFGKLARILISHFGATKESRVMILLILIALGAELGSVLHLEGIVGAFLVGIAVRRATSGKFLVKELEVLARSLFIPVFFLSTGFLVDLAVLKNTMLDAPGIVVGLVGALFAGKYAASLLTCKLLGYSPDERFLMFSLSLPQMAATLACAVVSYNTVDAQGERLLSIQFVNAAIVLVVVTCAIGPILTEIFARRIRPVGLTSPPAA